MSRPLPSAPDPDDLDACPSVDEAGLDAAAALRDTVDLELPLDDAYTVLVRLTVADLALQAGLDADQVAAVRDEASQLFADLCRAVDRSGSTRWRFEVIPGSLRLVARPSADPTDVAVRSWAPVPDVA